LRKRVLRRQKVYAYGHQTSTVLGVASTLLLKQPRVRERNVGA